MSQATHITGVLKSEVTLNGTTYKPGEELTVPVQFGWEEYFEKKSYSYLIDQIKVINYSLKNLDKKIITSFQIDYLNIIKGIIVKILREKYKDNSMGGVF